MKTTNDWVAPSFARFAKGGMESVDSRQLEPYEAHPNPFPHPTLMRLFIGLPMPAELANSLTRHARTISLSNARWTPPENIHLTLVFLGEVAEQKLPSIKHQLDKLAIAPFPIRLTDLNTFPRVGVLIAEIDPTPRLLHLHAQIASGMARCGFIPEDRPYHPHLTLARFHGQLRLSHSQRTLPASLQRSFTADTINLYRSNLTPTGSHYEILAQKKSSKPNQPTAYS
jgi:2'-5' RNA ligase